MSDFKIYLEVVRFQSGEERRKKNEDKKEDQRVAGDVEKSDMLCADSSENLYFL